MSGTTFPNEQQVVEFTVTEDCNGCGLCKNIAPDFFDYVEYAYYYFITRQPENEFEIALMREAASVCTLDAIIEIPKERG